MNIGWSNFAYERNVENKTFKKHPNKLIELVKKHWKNRKPGVGRKDNKKVTVVTIKEKNIHKLFDSGWIEVDKAKDIKGKATKRQHIEDSYIYNDAKGQKLPTKYAKVVLYSKEALLENNGTRSGDYDFEIVAIIAGPWKTEPMMPLTMARNYLQKPGGTYADYSPKEFAESIYFWSRYVRYRKE